MNEYKRAWMAAVDLLPEVQYSDSTPRQDSTGQQVYDQLKHELVTGAMTSLVMLGLKHAAQSQLKGRLGIAMRVGGRVGLRAVPIIGTAYTVYTIYDYLDDLFD
jgi:hypothetical protein